jgi:hypothetical protein
MDPRYVVAVVLEWADHGEQVAEASVIAHEHFLGRARLKIRRVT